VVIGEFTKRGIIPLSFNHGMRKRYVVILVILVTLGIYYPSIFGELSTVDDQLLVNSLINQNSIGLKSLFLRHSCYYYRPIVNLTFRFDSRSFFCQPELMHFVNILIHMLNVLLFFFLCTLVLKEKKNRVQEDVFCLPLLTSLFFAIHPLTTEPVNWISGRTDLLACLFCLISFSIFSFSSKKSRWWIDTIAAFFFLLGLLSKEVAISLFAVVVFSTFWKGLPSYTKSLQQRVVRIIPFFIFTIVYVWMRTGFHFSRDSGIKSAIKGAHGAAQIPYWSKIGSLIKALGFYAKKIIWPFPLNFAIVSINRPLCFILGILTLVGVIYLLWKREGKIRFFLLWSFLFIVPALPVAINRMAWTPLAERYLYLPLIGFSIAVGLTITRYPRQSVIIPFILILFGFGIVTTKRNIVWQRNLTLFADTVKKSPNFALAHNEYASALLREGKIDEARREYEIAAKLSGKGSAKALAAVNLAAVDNSTGVSETLEELIRSVKEKKLRLRLMRKLARDINRKILKTDNEAERNELLRMSVLIFEELRKLDKDPFILYRLGQLYLAQGEKQKAQLYFGQACKKSNDYYTEPACKLYNKLSGELAESGQSR